MHVLPYNAAENVVENVSMAYYQKIFAENINNLHESKHK